MRKLYQTSWHGIPFESLSQLSSKKLPDASFYDSFYKAFHEKYEKFDDLDRDWIRLKRKMAEWVMDHPRLRKESRVISVGCGVGVMEKAFLDAGFTNLEITEVSEAPLKWIAPFIPAEKMHVGFFPDNLPHDDKFDFVILASVDYFLDDAELADLLRVVRGRLAPGGTCLLISWSFDNGNFVSSLKLSVKDFVRCIMDRMNVRKLGQFWGYIRHAKEYRRLMESAGFKNIKDDLLDTGTSWKTYCMEAVAA